MTSKYDKSRHVLIEQSQMVPPKTEWFECYIENYERHIASLRTIPCVTGSIWEEDRIYEEGKDYKIEKDLVLADHWQDVPTHRLIAIPIPKEDDHWADIYEAANRNSWLSFAALVNKYYTITKKTV